MPVTPEEATDAYMDNADWFATSSIVKAKAYSTAIRQMLGFSEETWKQGAGSGARMRFNHEYLHEQLGEVEEWITSNDTASVSSAGVIDVDFREFDCRR